MKYLVVAAAIVASIEMPAQTGPTTRPPGKPGLTLSTTAFKDGSDNAASEDDSSQASTGHKKEIGMFNQPSSPRPSMRNQGAAIVAGAIAGLVGTFFKFGWDAFWPPRAAGRIPEPEGLVSMFTHHPTSLATSHLVSFLFSILSGVAYGALLEFFPLVALGSGLAFGFAVWLGAHELIMPWIGLTPPVWDLPANEQLAECFGHMFWGLAIGVFYGYFRRRWSNSVSH